MHRKAIVDVQDEEVLDPALTIVDSHHHLWPNGQDQYLIEEFVADITKSGHHIAATVYIECSVGYWDHVPTHRRSVGEVAFAANIATGTGNGRVGATQVCAGIVGGPDLSLGSKVAEVLDEMIEVGRGYFRGARNVANWDADPATNLGVRGFAPRGLLHDPIFRQGFAELAARQLTFDAFVYHPQLHDVAALADAFPNVNIVVNHCGGLLRVGGHNREDTFDQWRQAITTVAKRPNIYMKLGGLSAARCGWALGPASPFASSEALTHLWKPYLEVCIEAFGPQRCMFESNFPPDRRSGSYQTLWNVFKRCVACYSDQDKKALFSETANRFYHLN